MPDPNARERAAFRLVEILTPAAALGIGCTACGSTAGALCRDEHNCETMSHSHWSRREAARAELHSLLLTLGLGA